MIEQGADEFLGAKRTQIDQSPTAAIRPPLTRRPTP